LFKITIIQLHFSTVLPIVLFENICYNLTYKTKSQYTSYCVSNIKMKKEFLEMKKSVKSIVSIVSAIAMLSTSAMAVSAGTTAVNPIKDVNAISATSKTDFSAVKADAIVITSATTKMESAGLKLLQAQIGAERADQDSILAKIATMSADEVKAAVENVTKAAESNQDLKATVAEAVAEVKATVNAAAGVNADIVVSNVYNPINYISGGATVDAAKKAVQVYVDEINSEIAVIAKDNNVTVADVSNIEPATKISVADLKTGAETAATLKTVFEQQSDARTAGVNETTVAKDTVSYKYGDLNNDGKVKAVDLVIMLQYQLSKGSETPILSEETIANKGYTVAAGDVYKDGVTCDASDITRLKLFLLEDINESVLGTVAF